MDHSYEELRKVALEILSGKEKVEYPPNQYQHLLVGIAEVLAKMEHKQQETIRGSSGLSSNDREIFLELFWDLFRQGIITLGCDDANREFPFFRLTGLGRKIIENQEPYFFHDVNSYETVIKQQLPEIKGSTLTYLKEAMQSFLSGCMLSSSVMIGVASEDAFLSLLEEIENDKKWRNIYKNVFSQKTILQKFNKFKSILDQNVGSLPSTVKEDLDTNLSGILSIIRNFRNESGHPTGKIIGREQTYVLLNLFIPCCKKIYELIEYFKTD